MLRKRSSCSLTKVEPQKPVVFARRAAHGQIDGVRIAQRGENMPGRCDQQNNSHAAQRMKRLPNSGVEQLSGRSEIDQRRRDGEHQANQTLEQQADSQTGRHHQRPPARSRFRFIDASQERP